MPSSAPASDAKSMKSDYREVSDLPVHFRSLSVRIGDKVCLNPVSGDIEAGELVALMGCTGAGAYHFAPAHCFSTTFPASLSNTSRERRHRGAGQSPGRGIFLTIDRGETTGVSSLAVRGLCCACA